MPEWLATGNFCLDQSIKIYIFLHFDRIPADKGIDWRLGFTKESDLYEFVHLSLNLVSLYLLVGVEYENVLFLSLKQPTRLHVAILA